MLRIGNIAIVQNLTGQRFDIKHTTSFVYAVAFVWQTPKMALLQSIMDGSGEVKTLFKILHSPAGKKDGRAGMGRRDVRPLFQWGFLIDLTAETVVKRGGSRCELQSSTERRRVLNLETKEVLDHATENFGGV